MWTTKYSVVAALLALIYLGASAIQLDILALPCVFAGTYWYITQTTEQAKTQ